VIESVQPRTGTPAAQRLIPLLWGLCAAALGWFVATQPLVTSFAFLVLAGLALLTLITPLAALTATLVIAPIRTLFATESTVKLPLDIGQIGLIVVLGVWVLDSLARRRALPRLRWSTLFIPVMLFAIAGGLSAFSALSLGAWLNEWLKWVQILVLMAVSLSLAARREWEILLFGLVLAGLTNALIGLYEFFGGSGALHLLINDRFFRAFGTFGQPNPFGGFMGLIAPLALAGTLGYALRAWSTWRRDRRLSTVSIAIVGFYGLASALIIAGVFASWSRGAWLGFAASSLIMLVALPRRTWFGLALGTIIALGGLGLWASGRLPASIAERISSFTTETLSFTDVRAVDITPANYALIERFAHWQAAINMATDHPWLGVGLGNYEAAYENYRLINWNMALGHAHNYYLNVLAETGMIGLLAFAGLWIGLFALTARVRRHPDALARLVAVGLLGTWTYLGMHSLTDNLYVNNIFLHLGVMLGMLAVLYNQTWKHTPVMRTA
jgi:O-antigen ligase